MKFKLDPLFFKYSLYGFLAVAMSILFYLLLDNLGYYLTVASGAFYWVRRVLSPFLIGTLVAYILNPAARWFEKAAYGKLFKDYDRLRRIFSVITVYLILISMIVLLVTIIVPQISSNMRDIIRNSPEYINITNRVIREWMVQLESFTDASFMLQINNRISTILNSAVLMAQNNIERLLFSFFSFTSGVMNFILGIIISFYMLLDKENFKLGIEKVLRLIFNDRTVEKAKELGREVDDLFSKFIVGKSIDSFIIAIICFIGLNLMSIRYALLITLIVGITNMIPYFGPFIGAVPAILITFFDDPVKAVWITLFIFVLQQFDGWILGPKILGDSVGVSPFWIILAIIVGGKLFGILGMFLGVPAMAVLRLISIRFIDKQLEKKTMKPDL